MSILELFHSVWFAPFLEELVFEVGFGLLLERCICDLLCTTLRNMRLADVRAVTQQEVMDAEIKLNEKLLLRLRSNTSIRKETTDAILVCACRSICKPEMPGTTMTRPLEGYLIPVRRVRDQYLTGADKEAIRKEFVFGAAYPFEDDEDDLPSNARWLSIRNRSLVVSAKEMAAGETTLLRGEALKKLRSLDAEQSIFIASGSGAAASAPAAAPRGSETVHGQSVARYSRARLLAGEALFRHETSWLFLLGPKVSKFARADAGHDSDVYSHGLRRGLSDLQGYHQWLHWWSSLSTSQRR